jgi:phage-related protein
VRFSPVIFYHPARDEILSWPADVKKELGSVLTLLQKGESVGMPDVRPMPSVGKGVSEIRISKSSGAYRAFFVVWTEHGILIFHGFKKKTQTTPKIEIETGRKRLNAFMEELVK